MGKLVPTLSLITANKESMNRSFVKKIIRASLGWGVSERLHARVWARRLRKDRPGEVTQVVAKYVAEGDRCFDIGAHGGAFAIELSKQVGEKGLVCAIEALPYYARTLERALRILAVDNIRVINAAVADYEGDIEMVVRQDGKELTGRTHILGADENGVRRTERTRVTRLDQIIKRNPEFADASFLKVDVEGAELAVFEGSRSFLERNKPVIYCEIVDEYCQRYGHGANEVFALLKEFSYQSEKVTPVDYIFLPS